jgi:alpha-tubulin suppressor-like RCC1 family protein
MLSSSCPRNNRMVQDSVAATRNSHLLVAAAIATAAIGAAQPSRTPIKIDGESHKLVLFSDGTVGGWGDMRDGQLGPRSGVPNSSGHSTAFVPIAIPGTAKVIDIAAASRSSYVLLDDGTVMAFGRGAEGQLGCGQSCIAAAGSELPIPVANLRDVVRVVARQGTAFAVHRNGSVSTWGTRTFGEGPSIISTPEPLPNLPPIRQISIGSGFVLALTTEGRVWMWGKLPFGRVYSDDPLQAPAEVPNLVDVRAVVATRVAAVLKNDGTVWVWGNNEQAQFGNGKRDVDDRTRIPVRVPGVANATDLAGALAGRHFIALLKDGSIRAWGNSDWGQVGIGVTGREQATVVTPKLTGVKAVFAAGNNSFAIRGDQSLWIWGHGASYSGQWPMKQNASIPVRLEFPQVAGPAR